MAAGAPRTGHPGGTRSHRLTDHDPELWARSVPGAGDLHPSQPFRRAGDRGHRCHLGLHDRRDAHRSGGCRALSEGPRLREDTPEGVQALGHGRFSRRPRPADTRPGHRPRTLAWLPEDRQQHEGPRGPNNDNLQLGHRHALQVRVCQRGAGHAGQVRRDLPGRRHHHPRQYPRVRRGLEGSGPPDRARGGSGRDRPQEPDRRRLHHRGGREEPRRWGPDASRCHRRGRVWVEERGPLWQVRPVLLGRAGEQQEGQEDQQAEDQDSGERLGSRLEQHVHIFCLLRRRLPCLHHLRRGHQGVDWRFPRQGLRVSRSGQKRLRRRATSGNEERCGPGAGQLESEGIPSEIL
mmetsp:Transcript_96838/g.252421  ORF Transcript_96838/g.252421 Transcript_96838/m.252421 type:complete len:349 (+) Transcript_96838:411-1457(+)